MRGHGGPGPRSWRRRLLPAVLALTGLGAMAGPAAAQSTLPPALANACPNAHAEPRTAPPRALGTATVCLVNRLRASRGLPTLRPNPQLNSFATSFTRRMVGQRFFSHDVPGGPTFSRRANASAYARAAGRVSMGENLAWATGSLATPAAIVEAWLRSPGHRANIMRRNFRDIGVGVVAAAPEAGWGDQAPATYVHAFGVRAPR